MNALLDRLRNRPAYTLPIALGAIHGLVDATTVMTFFRAGAIHDLSRPDFFTLAIAYNLIAFATQPFFGLVLDDRRWTREGALTGLLLVAVGVAALPLDPWLAVVVGALGNSLFHVGAGALTIRAAGGHSAPLGLFVAPGALGVAVGVWVGNGAGPIWPFALAIGVSGALLWLMPRNQEPRAVPSFPWTTGKLAAIVALLLFSIAVRSFVGQAGGYLCPNTVALGFAFAAAGFAGKANGGLLADRFGWLETSMAALPLSAPLLAFGGSNAAVVIVGAFIFQMTMPVTLAAVAALFARRPAFAFGLASCAYVFGAMPTYFAPTKSLYGSSAFLILIALSAAAIFGGLKPLKKVVATKFVPSTAGSLTK